MAIKSVNAAIVVALGIASSTTDDAALARWGDGNRLRLSGNAGILLVLEGK